MNFDSTSLTVGVFAGVFGSAYILYGKKQQRPVPILAGFALWIVPFIPMSNATLIAVCAGLAILPFLIRIEL